jgi:hypothetical protein
VTGFARQLRAKIASISTSMNANANARSRSVRLSSSLILKHVSASASKPKNAPTMNTGTTEAANASADLKTAHQKLNTGTPVPAHAAAWLRIATQINISTTIDATASANQLIATRQASEISSCQNKSGLTTQTARASASTPPAHRTTTTKFGFSTRTNVTGSVKPLPALKASTLTQSSVHAPAFNLLAQKDTSGAPFHVSANVSTTPPRAQTLNSLTPTRANASPARSQSFQAASILSFGTH